MDTAIKFSDGNLNSIELVRKSELSGLILFSFRCEWCAGEFNIFSDEPNLNKLKTIRKQISSGKKHQTWTSEEGDVELVFSVGNTGIVVISVFCHPSMNLQNSGEIKFTIELGLAAFD